MIDIIVDDDVPEDGGETFEPPQALDSAVLAACRVAGFNQAESPGLCVRFASDASVQALNAQWRARDCVTDVLSFPMQEPPVDEREYLGDIALALPFVALEAERLQLPFDAHCLHLIVHATLHLLGFDHVDDGDADRMQALENKAMQALGLHQPYPACDVAEVQR